MKELLTIVGVIVLALPFFAMVGEHLGNVRISERHHSHHDTFVVPVALTRGIVFALVAMGSVGLVATALAWVGLLPADSFLVVSFFDSFVATGLVFWWLCHRYKVSTFEDAMSIRPFIGPVAWVRYRDINAMAWTGYRKGSGYRDLELWVDGKPTARLSALVDIERILMRIDRFDVMAHSA